jgi:hypothetical protein
MHKLVKVMYWLRDATSRRLRKVEKIRGVFELLLQYCMASYFCNADTSVTANYVAFIKSESFNRKIIQYTIHNNIRNVTVIQKY